MKKAYLYFLLPLVGLALFGAVYYQFSRTYEQKAEAREAAVRAKRDAQVEEENRNRTKAMEEAIAAKKKRDAEKEVRLAREAKDKEDRELAEQNLRKARADADKLEAQAKRIAGEIELAKKELQKTEEDKAKLVNEEAFLKDYVKQVVSNRANLQAVVEKIDAADKAIEAAAKEQAQKEAAARAKK
jgi:colicin import membrane protein